MAKKPWYRSIEMVRARLKDRQIECLAQEYPGTRAQCQFKCSACEHQWPSTLNIVLSMGCGCPKCAKSTTKRLKNKASRRFSQFLKQNQIQLVSAYAGTREEAEFECGMCHHKWSQTPRQVEERGCPKCNPMPAGPTLDNQGYRRLVSRLAKQHIQLASPYRGMAEDNEFECTVCHHKWWQRPSNTKYCPMCDPPPQGPVPGQYPGKKYPRR